MTPLHESSDIKIVLCRISIPNAICILVDWEHTTPVIMFPIMLIASESLSNLDDILDRSNAVVSLTYSFARFLSISM